jgi:ATP-dependent helicase HrpB
VLATAIVETSLTPGVSIVLAFAAPSRQGGRRHRLVTHRAAGFGGAAGRATRGKSGGVARAHVGRPAFEPPEMASDLAPLMLTLAQWVRGDAAAMVDDPPRQLRGGPRSPRSMPQAA